MVQTNDHHDYKYDSAFMDRLEKEAANTEVNNMKKNIKNIKEGNLDQLDPTSNRSSTLLHNQDPHMFQKIPINYNQTFKNASV